MWQKPRTLLTLLTPLSVALVLSLLLLYAFPLTAAPAQAAPDEGLTLLGYGQGSGSIAGSQSSSASFRFRVSHNKDGSAMGQLQYVDPGANIQFRSSAVRMLEIVEGEEPDSLVGSFMGRGQLIGGGTMAFMVTTADNGSPGVGIDTFEITLANGYTNFGTLSSGDAYIGCLTCTLSMEASFTLGDE